MWIRLIGKGTSKRKPPSQRSRSGWGVYRREVGAPVSGLREGVYARVPKLAAARLAKTIASPP